LGARRTIFALFAGCVSALFFADAAIVGAGFAGFGILADLVIAGLGTGAAIRRTSLAVFADITALVSTGSAGACAAIGRAGAAVFAWIANAISAGGEATARIGLTSPVSAILSSFAVFVIATSAATACDTELAGGRAVGIF
jgi:hypothetical protein